MLNVAQPRIINGLKSVDRERIGAIYDNNYLNFAKGLPQRAFDSAQQEVGPVSRGDDDAYEWCIQLFTPTRIDFVILNRCRYTCNS